jgi:serine/threonine protein kinase
MTAEVDAKPNPPAGYQIVRTLGEGGMGRVYEAVHVPSGTRVALKTLKPELDTQAARRALLNEATTIAQLRDRNIVELLDVGRGENGALFLVVEHVDGGDLEHWVARWPGVHEVLRVVGEVLSALSVAHGQHVVHGDLKPANVLLTLDRTVKVVDFGIALVMDPLRDSHADIGLAGTPLYMAPERFLGDAVGPWTDLYAVGVMLHELLAGCSPFNARSLPAMLEQKSAGPPPLVVRSGVAIPDEMRELVRALLAPNPRARPRFAALVADVLVRLAPEVRDVMTRSGSLGQGGGPALAYDRTSTPEELAEMLSSASISNTSTSNTSISNASISDTGVTRDSWSSSAATRSSSRAFRVETGPWVDLPTSNLDLGAALVRLRSIPLVGRQRELRTIAALCDATIESGGVRVVVITGEAGVGKSRLARHFFSEVERTGTMEGVAAGYDATGSSMAGGLKHALRRLLGRPREDDAAAWAARVGMVGVEAVELLHQWLADAVQVSAERAASLTHAVLRRVSETRPVFVWLDDFGWSDDGAVTLALRLLEAQDARVVVVATVRSGTVEHPTVRAKLEHLLARADVANIDVARMNTEDRRALLGAIAPLAKDVASALATALDEPPLLLVELVHDWITSGQLETSSEGLRPAGGTSVSSMLAHRSIGTVIGQRLEALLGGLDEDAAAAIMRAALLGARFDEASLRASCVDLRDSAVDEALDHALLHGLLRVEPDRTYRFEHALYQEGLVARLPPGTVHHRAVAEGLIAAFGQRRSDVLVRAAHMLRELGDGDASRARLLEAIQVALHEYVADDALELLRTLAEWLDKDAVPEASLERGSVLHMEAVTHYFLLDYGRARAYSERASRTFQAAGDEQRVAESVMLTANTLFYEDRFVEAEVVCAALALDPSTSPRVRTGVQMRLADIRSLRGDARGAIAALEVARAISADPWRHHVVACNLMERELLRGDLTRAGELLDDMRRASKRGDAYARATESMELRTDVVWGRFESARSAIVRHVRFAEQHQDLWSATALRAVGALVSAALDPPEEVPAEVRALLAAWARVRHDEPFTHWTFDRLAERLDERGMRELSQEVAHTIAVRRAEVARAFGEGAVT